jgi:4'-phosphopantetheinyl transferase
MMGSLWADGGAGFEQTLPVEGARVYYAFQDGLSPDARDRLMALLSESERTRQARFLRNRDRDLFLLAHGMLRHVLAAHAGVSPHALRFATGDHGRPELSGPPQVKSLRFNLTHTRGLAACAVANGRAVGVDAEDLLRKVDRVPVSARVFSDAEIHGIEKLSGTDATERFYLHWTLKEAYVKALGLGFSLPLRRITITPGPDERASLQLDDLADVDDDPRRWIFRTHRAGGQHLIALAVEDSADAPVTFEKLSLA